MENVRNVEIEQESIIKEQLQKLEKSKQGFEMLYQAILEAK